MRRSIVLLLILLLLFGFSAPDVDLLLNYDMAGVFRGNGKKAPVFSEKTDCLDKIYFLLESESGKEITLSIKNNTTYDMICPSYLCIFQMMNGRWEEIRSADYNTDDRGVVVHPGIFRENAASTVVLKAADKTDLESGQYKVTLSQVRLMRNGKVIHLFKEIRLYFQIR